jgi:thioredoxin-related protein
MKHISFFLGCYLLVAGNVIQAQNRSINFEHGSFTEALAKSKATGKPIFFDAYTAWCIPCQMMLKKVFTVDSVADYCNTHFVNVKFDMEKGEGPGLGRKYMVNAYPTYLVLDAKGKELHRFSSSQTPEEFMKDLVFTDDTATQNIIARFLAGKRDSVFTKRALITAFNKSRFTALDQMLAQLDKEKVSKDTWLFFWLTKSKTDGRAARFMMDHKALFIAKVGVDEMDHYFYNFIANTIGHYAGVERLDPEHSNKIKEMIRDDVASAETQQFLFARLEMAEGKLEKNTDKMLKVYQSVLIRENPGDRYFSLRTLTESAAAFGSRRQCEEMLAYVRAELKALGSASNEKMFEENELAALNKRISELKTNS